mgnify:CR=1 FL=1
MVDFTVLILVGASTGVAYFTGRRVLHLRPMALGAALRSTLEWVGLTAVFMAANVLVGLVAVLALRAAQVSLVSLYGVADVAVAVLSSLQATAFRAWLTSREPRTLTRAEV